MVPMPPSTGVKFPADYPYWSKFPADYLRTIRLKNIEDNRGRHPLINLYHTRQYNLLNTVNRTEFNKEFVALLRFVSAGEAKVGYLYPECRAIHRRGTDSNAESGDDMAEEES